MISTSRWQESCLNVFFIVIYWNITILHGFSGQEARKSCWGVGSSDFKFSTQKTDKNLALNLFSIVNCWNYNILYGFLWQDARKSCWGWGMCLLEINLIVFISFILLFYFRCKRENITSFEHGLSGDNPPQEYIVSALSMEIVYIKHVMLI